MKQIAKITKLTNNEIQIRYDSPAAPKSRLFRGFWGVKEYSFPAENPNKICLREGDRVEILVDTGRTIGSAFMVFIFPLLLALAGTAAVTVWLPAWNDGFKALAGLALFLAGLGINMLLSFFRKKRGRQYLPKILRIVEKMTPEEMRENKDCAGCGLCG